MADGLVVGVDGDDAGDIAGDGGGAEALEHADALVALLDVEAAHVLVAADGVAYALVAEVGGAELYPLEGELGVRPEQGHKIGRKGGAAALALGATIWSEGMLMTPRSTTPATMESSSISSRIWR